MFNSYTIEDYEFLERELAEYKKSYKCETRAEERLLREVCVITLQVREARRRGDDTEKLLKQMQDLMKTCANLKSKINYKGDNMLNGYDIAVPYGFSGTERQWLESLYDKPQSKINQIIRCEYCDSENIIDNTTGAKKCTQCGAVLKLHCEKEKQNSSEFNSVMADWIKFHEESCPWSDTIETEEQTLQRKKKYALRDFLETCGGQGNAPWYKGVTGLVVIGSDDLVVATGAEYQLQVKAINKDYAFTPQYQDLTFAATGAISVDANGLVTGATGGGTVKVSITAKPQVSITFDVADA